jgi:type I restriction enzyme S subunit
MKWDNKLIGDVAEICSGYAFKSAEMTNNNEPNSYPIIKIKNVNDRSVSKDCDSYLPESLFKSNYSKYTLLEGDILIAMTGQGSVGRIGKMREINQIYLINQRVGIVRVDRNVASPEFIFQLISNPKSEKYYYDLAFGAGQPNLSPTDIGSLKITCPPLPIQRKIASILSAYDDLIENNLKRIKLLEEKAQLHYKELMQEVSNSKLKREEYLKDCLSFYIGGGWGEEEYKEGFTEAAFVIRGTDIPNAKKGEVLSVPFRYHKESNLASRSMKAGDIVFEVSGGSKGQPVGRSLLITEKMLIQLGKPVICASFCKMLRPNENVTSEYFYLYLMASQENGLIAQYEKHSASNIVNYGFEEFIGEQKITIPKQPILTTFTKKVKPIFTLISTLGDQNTKLREARDIILPRLMSGQIEV